MTNNNLTMITPNGVVDSYSIFAKIEEVMGVTE